MLLMIDNYDSFTYNVVQYFGELGVEVQVVRNDEIAVGDIEALAPEQIVISPGPCTPNEAGISMAVIRSLRRGGADSRDLPGPPEYRPGVRRQGGAGAQGHARQDLADTPPAARGFFAG